MIKMAPNRKQEQRNTTRATGANSEGARSNKAQCRNQGSPQPGSPRSQRAAIPGMTYTLTLWSKHRQRRVATKVVRRATAVKQESETWSSVKMTAKLRHSGRAQSPLSCPFSSISITHAVVRSTTVLVLLQVIFMVWKIVLIISTWWYLCIELFRWRASSFGCMIQQQYGLFALGLLRSLRRLYNYLIYSQFGGVGVWQLPGQ